MTEAAALSPPAVAPPDRGPAVAGQPLRPSDALGVGGSLLLHAGFVVMLAVFVATRPAVAPPEASIPVEMVTPEEFDTLLAAPGAAGEPATPPAGAMVRPTVMLSARVLADPRSRQARELLPTLDDTERMIQLCGLEAMEQVHAWRDGLEPERVVAYATADPAVRGDRVRAEGAAFRSGGAWYRLSFDCRLAPGHGAVTSFAFRVGAAIPRAEWEARNLPADQ